MSQRRKRTNLSSQHNPTNNPRFTFLQLHPPNYSMYYLTPAQLSPARKNSRQTMWWNVAQVVGRV